MTSSMFIPSVLFSGLDNADSLPNNVNQLLLSRPGTMLSSQRMASVSPLTVYHAALRWERQQIYTVGICVGIHGPLYRNRLRISDKPYYVQQLRQRCILHIRAFLAEVIRVPASRHGRLEGSLSDHHWGLPTLHLTHGIEIWGHIKLLKKHRSPLASRPLNDFNMCLLLLLE